MSVILDVINKLQDTSVEISKFEEHLKKSPSKTVSLALDSLYKVREKLESEFSDIANIEHLDICDYRLIADKSDRLSVSALSSTLKEFQTMFTVVFNALKTGPKERAIVAPDIAQQSSFDFAYTYSGSLGFVLTVPRERLLFQDALDNAVDLIFNVAKAKDIKEISDFAQKVGIAAIRKVYSWSESHSKYGINADIKWHRKDEKQKHLTIQIPELKHLQEMIEATSPETIETITVTGEVTDYGSSWRTFHMEIPDTGDIKGKVSGDFDYSHSYKIPDRYTATIAKRTKVHYSYEKEDISYELLSLKVP